MTTNRTLKTLAEHDAERMEFHSSSQQINQSHANGIECPTCGKELWDTNPMVLLTSYPSRKAVHCPACGYSGTRIA